MSILKVIWAQALDNTSDDQIEFEGHLLSPDDEEGRQHAVSLLSSSTSASVSILETENLRLLSDLENNNYVLEVSTQQQDDVGRKAPIICLGRIVPDNTAPSVESTLEELNQFSMKIDRSIAPEITSDMMHAMEELKKKLSSTKKDCPKSLAETIASLWEILITKIRKILNF